MFVVGESKERNPRLRWAQVLYPRAKTILHMQAEMDVSRRAVGFTNSNPVTL